MLRGEEHVHIHADLRDNAYGGKDLDMLQAGINLIYIRKFLGYVHLETTEIYVKADTEMKRRTIESDHIKIDSDLPAWADDKNLMALLTNLCSKD